MTRDPKGFGKAQGFDVKAYRRRLRIMREVISGDNQTDFARRLGIDYKRWSNYERGYPVPRQVAFLLHRKFPGISIEWIYFGSMASLSAAYKEGILEAERIDAEREQDLARLRKLEKKMNRTNKRIQTLQL